MTTTFDRRILLVLAALLLLSPGAAASDCPPNSNHCPSIGAIPLPFGATLVVAGHVRAAASGSVGGAVPVHVSAHAEVVLEASVVAASGNWTFVNTTLHVQQAQGIVLTGPPQTTLALTPATEMPVAFVVPFSLAPQAVPGSTILIPFDITVGDRTERAYVAVTPAQQAALVASEFVGPGEVVAGTVGAAGGGLLAYLACLSARKRGGRDPPLPPRPPRTS